MSATGREITRKLSAATITGLGRNEIAEKGRTTSTILYGIVGVARGYKTGESIYGPWTALIGEFEATSYIDGVTYSGGKVFLPPHVTDMLIPAIQGHGDDAAIEFALLVGVRPCDNQFGYEYFAENYRDPEQSDRLKGLRSMLPTPKVLKEIAGPGDKDA